MKLKLPDSVSSAQDVKSLVLEVKRYAQWFLHAGVKQRVKAGSETEPPAISDAAMALIREAAGGKELTQQTLDGLVEDLEIFADEAPSMTITLAAMPSGGLKKTLVAWCRQNVEPDVLVSFNFNSTLLGGMVVRYGSRIYDWSFRRQILSAGGHFTEVLHRV